MVAVLLAGGSGARVGTVPGAWLCLMALLQLLGSAPRGSGLAHGRRLICWQALLQCQGEPECSYAYNQYAEACAPVLAQRGGGVMGCVEARRRCERDSRCNLALNRYLTYCGKLFNGLRCTDECRTVIEDMLAVPKAALLNDCVCDGLERPICESVKENMARLCFGADLGNGPGSSGSDGGLDDYYDEEYDEEPRLGGAGSEQPLDDDDGVPHAPRPGGGAAAAAAGGRGEPPYGPGRRSVSGGGGRAVSRGAGTPLASILLLLLGRLV
ncbi:PREDICTED: growth arrest-specific protein 1 [Dipodomys ordii]|uniref:Growth arrest-specific protein 1 n=1 Tax=Dipodomys ordii TaxID=10020 RepID=A0A1S3GE78_DIPOR|nr:PREDICTED: growth arrest-specific protein 1 [Dipodomys ordii]